LLVFSNTAHAEQSLGEALQDGTPIADLRARYEAIDDKSKTLSGQALTLRARLGYETGVWNGFSLAFDFDAILADPSRHNDTRNGKTAYPTIADPGMATLNRLQLTYATDFDTRIVLGRQRLQFGNQRFVGNAGWRQHEQTYDALSFVNSSVKNLVVTYAYVARVNRVFGPGDPVPATGSIGSFDSNSHLFNAVYAGIPGLRLEGYAYLLRLSQNGPAAAMVATAKLSTATFGARAEYRIDLAAGLAAQINGEFAHQDDFGNNPLSISLDYGLVESSLAYHNFTGLVGYEALGGDGTIGFSTPLASLHPFNGWADLFLTTPVNGLDDFYLKGNYAIPDFLGMKSLNAVLAYHDFTADRTGADLGNEWDASLELVADKNLSFLLKYADYSGAGGLKDKSVAWLQLAYKI
jgi:hypothetical protein